jgi:hypothetical protein
MSFQSVQAREKAASLETSDRADAARSLKPGSPIGALGARDQLRALQPTRPMGPRAAGAQAGTDAAPLQMLRGGAQNAVQMDELPDTRPINAALDIASMLKVIEAMKSDGIWDRLLGVIRGASVNGTRALDPAIADNVLLDALIFVEEHFQFGNGLTLDDLLNNPVAQRRIVGAMLVEAMPDFEIPAEEALVLPLPPAGSFGVVTRAVELTTLDGANAITLPAGTAVEVKGALDGQIRVMAHSGIEMEGTIDPTAFKVQPRLGKDSKTNKTHGHTYQEFVGELFIGNPSVNDVDQGGLGDCYLISAMGAVAAANPDVIRQAVKYNGDGTYSVTFQELQRDGRTFSPHVEVVDAYLPSRGGGRAAYGMNDKAFDPKDQALWPAIIEKAYAQWKGGYDAMGNGGLSSQAMQEITGVRSTREAMPREEDVIERFKSWQAAGKAVVCGTRDWMQQTNKTGLLNGNGDGPYTGTLTDEQDAPAHVVEGSVLIDSEKGKPRAARADAAGELKGPDVASGRVDFENGDTEVVYNTDRGPASAEELRATYRFQGNLDSSLTVYGDHAYMFSEVQGETLVFRNPWGPAARNQPKPLTASDFLRLFETIGVNAVIPQQPK